MACSEAVQEEEEEAHGVQHTVDDEGKTGAGKTSRRPEWQQTLKQVKGCASSAVGICVRKAKEAAKDRSWAEQLGSWGPLKGV